MSVVNGKLRVTSSNGGTSMFQNIKVKPNTNYYLAANLTVGSKTPTIIIYNTTWTQGLRNGVGTFNTGVYDEISLNIAPADTGYADYDSIMLVEGTIAPISYQSCEKPAFVLEGQFGAEDNIIIKCGKPTGQLNWRHPSPLYGKDYDWQFGADYVGSKG
jgi:hypothetical protein